MSLWQKKLIDAVIFISWWHIYSEICLWSVSNTLVMLHSQWHYWLSSLHKEYLWYKFQAHVISRSWDTSAVCIPVLKIMTGQWWLAVVTTFVTTCNNVCNNNFLFILWLILKQSVTLCNRSVTETNIWQ